MKYGLLLIAVLVLPLRSAEGPNGVSASLEAGNDLLRKVAAGDDAQVVPAAKLFLSAAESAEKSGKEDEAQNAYAILYWLKKRMNIQQQDQFLQGTQPGALAKADLKVDASDAQQWMDRAKAFADANPDKMLLISIRYFEVADRFAGTPVSIQAQRLSLDTMQKVRLTPALSKSRNEKAEAEFQAEVAKAKVEFDYKVGVVQAEFESKVNTAKTRLISGLEAEKLEVMKKGNLDRAVELKNKIEKYKATDVVPVSAEKPHAAFNLAISALIDGNTELHITPQGIYWKSLGAAKTGRHGGANEPTYVNDKPWLPKWNDPTQERGFDSTNGLPLTIGPTDDLVFELISVGEQRSETGIADRDPVQSHHQRGEFVIFIPDTQPGAMWYTFRIKKNK